MSVNELIQSKMKDFDKFVSEIVAAIKDAERRLAALPNEINALQKKYDILNVELEAKFQQKKAQIERREKAAEDAEKLATAKLHDVQHEKDKLVELQNRAIMLNKEIEAKQKLLDNQIASVSAKEAVLAEKLTHLDNLKSVL